MKKRILCALLLIFALAAFSACGADDPVGNDTGNNGTVDSQLAEDGNANDADRNNDGVMDTNGNDSTNGDNGGVSGVENGTNTTGETLPNTFNNGSTDDTLGTANTTENGLHQ